jgi:hypothetical protein
MKLSFKKKELINLIRKKELINESLDGFTDEEFRNIVNSYVNGEEYESYYPSYEGFTWLVYKILDHKSNKFKKYINKFLREKKDALENKMKKISNTNIRVACFSRFKNDNGFMNKSQMWAHYADNHKGICVEYDISPLIKDIAFSLESWEFYENKEEYLEERLLATIKGGLFPIIYTSNRVRLPYTKLKKLNPSKRNFVEELLYKAYITKSTNWSYENEWRLIVDEEISEYFGNKIPFPFIKRIFLGCNIPEMHKKLLIDIGKEHNVEVRLMHMEQSKFRLDYKFSDQYDFMEEMKRNKNPYNV